MSLYLKHQALHHLMHMLDMGTSMTVTQLYAFQETHPYLKSRHFADALFYAESQHLKCIGLNPANLNPPFSLVSEQTPGQSQPFPGPRCALQLPQDLFTHRMIGKVEGTNDLRRVPDNPLGLDQTAFYRTSPRA